MHLKEKRKKRIYKIHKIQETKDKSKTENHHLQSAYIAANLAEEKKGENILLLDVSRLTIIADYFIIITAKSTPQIEAIANHIEETLTKLKYPLIFKEGFSRSNWVVLDFGDLVIHIMNERERNYYNLERFWSNAIPIERTVWRKAS